MCRNRALKIHYFEEGLGTYKNENQMRFPSNAKMRVGKLGIELMANLRSFHKAALFINYESSYYLLAIFFFLRALFYRLILDVLYSFWKFFFSFPLIHRCLAIILPSPFKSYYLVWNDIDLCTVWFPDALDKNVFKCKLDKFPIDKCDFDFIQPELESIGFNYQSRFQNSSIFISQKYTSNTKDWARILADVISEYTQGTLYIKFHPKETDAERQITLTTLDQNNIRAKDIDPQGKFDALKLITNCNFKEVIGLSSSVLVYGRLLAPHAKFRSIAPEMLANSKRLNVCKGGAERMFSDYVLLKSLICFSLP